MFKRKKELLVTLLALVTMLSSVSFSKPSYPKPSYPKPSYPKPSYPKPSYPKPSYPKPRISNFSYNEGTTPKM